MTTPHPTPPESSMVRTVITWLASLRVRLIVTYVFITLLSFAFVALQLMSPVEKFIMRREAELLIAVARTLGSTINSPFESSEDAYLRDLRWTQRRCRNSLITKFPGMRIRVLDPQGRLLVDSAYEGDWDDLYAERMRRSSLADRQEVKLVIEELRDSYVTRPREIITPTRHPDPKQHPDAIYVAWPVVRADRDTGMRHLAFIMYLDRPIDSVKEDMTEMSDLIRISLLTSLIITVLVSILLSGNLSAGLNAATRIARAFASGDWSQRMRATGVDEVGQLGNAFNQMADALHRQEQLRRDLLADVSHELRTPLTAIAGCADTLADGVIEEDPEAAERFLGIIQRESERMQRLVSDILELSKLQARAVEIPRQPMAIVPLIDDAVEIARLHTRADGVLIEWNPPADTALLRVIGNEDRLAQALRNLLDNARHHSPAGRAITVSVVETREEIIIRIQDEGEGIPATDLPWVFDRFYRAGKGGKAGGSGLGLAIVREIMLALQGLVTVESEVGVGTTFSLHLPRAHAEQDDTLVLPHHRGGRDEGAAASPRGQG